MAPFLSDASMIIRRPVQLSFRTFSVGSGTDTEPIQEVTLEAEEVPREVTSQSERRAF